jgi:hypothetical protein
MKHYAIDLEIVIQVDHEDDLNMRIKDLINLAKQREYVVDIEHTGGPDELSRTDG